MASTLLSCRASDCTAAAGTASASRALTFALVLASAMGVLTVLVCKHSTGQVSPDYSIKLSSRPTVQAMLQTMNLD